MGVTSWRNDEKTIHIRGVSTFLAIPPEYILLGNVLLRKEKYIYKTGNYMVYNMQ
jgi:hypothetical protein